MYLYIYTHRICIYIYIYKYIYIAPFETLLLQAWEFSIAGRTNYECVDGLPSSVATFHHFPWPF